MTTTKWGIGRQVRIDGPDLMVLVEGNQWDYDKPGVLAQILFDTPQEARNHIKEMGEGDNKSVFLVSRVISSQV